MTTPRGAEPPRPDASMDLLRQIAAEAVDPEYARVAALPGTHRSHVWGAAGAALVAILLTVAIVGHLAQGPSDQAERTQLAKQVAQMQASVKQQQAAVQGLSKQVSRKQAQALPSAQARTLQSDEQAAGADAMTGPGLVVVANDAPQATSDDQRVSDDDLRILVNGLWQAGAEAISINGQRLVSTSSIRSAGSAITVNYVSLSAPYRVVALGDPASMPGELARSEAGERWTFLHGAYGLTWTVDTGRSLSVPAGTIIAPAQAKAVR